MPTRFVTERPNPPKEPRLELADVLRQAVDQFGYAPPEQIARITETREIAPAVITDVVRRTLADAARDGSSLQDLLDQRLATLDLVMKQPLDDQVLSAVLSSLDRNIDALHNLKPEEYLLDVTFPKSEAHQLLVEAWKINPERVQPDAAQFLNETLKTADVVMCGIDHSSAISHEYLANVIRQLNVAEDVIIGLEEDPGIQTYIDHFLTDGVFIAGEDPQEYQRIYQAIQHEGNWDVLDEGRKTYLHDDYHGLVALLPILQAARERGFVVKAIDKYYSASRWGEGGRRIEDARRDEGMVEMMEAFRQPNKKIFMIGGAEHIQTRERLVHLTDDKIQISHPSAGQLAKQQWGEKGIVTVRLDNQSHLQRSLGGEITDAVLFDVMKQHKSADTNPALVITADTFPDAPDMDGRLALDCYILVYQAA